MSEGMIRSCACLRCGNSPIAFSVYATKRHPRDLTPRFGATYEAGISAIPPTPYRITNGLSGDSDLEGYRTVTIDYSWCDALNNPQTATAVTEQNRYYDTFIEASLTTSCDGLVYQFTHAKDGTQSAYYNPALYDGSHNYVGASPCLTADGSLGFGNVASMTNCLGIGHSAAGFFFATVSETATVRVEEMRQHNFPSADIVIGTRTTTLSDIYTTAELRADVDELMAIFDMSAINTTPVTLTIFTDHNETLTFGKVDVADVWVINVVQDLNAGTSYGGQILKITGVNAGAIIPAPSIETYLRATINNLTFTPISSYFYAASSAGLTDIGFSRSFHADGIVAQKSWIRDDVIPGKIVFFEQAYDIDPLPELSQSWLTCGSYQDHLFGIASTKPDAVCIGLPTVPVGGLEQAMPAGTLKGYYFMEGVGTPTCASPC